MKRPVRQFTQERLEHEVARSARDFLVAFWNTRITSRELPPVRAAGLGLVPAWNDWVRVLEAWGGERLDRLRLSARADYGPPQAGQAATDLFVEAIRVNNPAFHATLTQGEVQRPVLLASAAALYEVRPHAVIEPTDALQTWLAQTDIGDDVPVSLFQLPMPAVFIRFGPEMARVVDPSLWADVDREFTTSGVYIFETLVEGRRDLVFVAVGTTLEHDQELPMSLQLCFADMNDSLIDHVCRARRSLPDPRSSAIPMVQMCAKVLLYMQTAGAVRIDDLRQHDAAARLVRAGNRKASKLERRLASRYNRIIVGPAELIRYAASEVAPHWRRGHLRMQAHGPQLSLRKLIFIAPTLVRADRLHASDAGNHRFPDHDRSHPR
ncbi:hypothetical protein [Paraburkholderia sp. J76]|uniref:hypothetical protein n=1 Tax=Paraburkholderia sp. J76 TaxID=2805439 RepID=UPI002ABDAECC|nr:hypothetical protein [Paraburkholderia sp. J76]